MKKWNPPFLKQLELLTWCIRCLGLASKIQFNVGELFVSNAYDTHFTKLRQYGLHTFTMNFGIFHTGTMADVDGKLEHGESILNETLPEFSIFLDIFLRLCREVEQY